MKNGNHRPTVIRKRTSARRMMRTASFALLFVTSAVAVSMAGLAPAGQPGAASQPSPSNAAAASLAAAGGGQGAEQLSVSAKQQIAALTAEKRSRTPAQRKMDSRLIYAVKMARGEQIAEGVGELEVNLARAGGDRVIVDITANFDRDFVGHLKGLGAKLLVSLPQYRTARVEVSLSAVEAIAALPEVINVRPMDEAITQRQQQDGSKGGKPASEPQVSLTRTDLELRLAAVKERLAAALGDFETNAYNVNVNGVRKSQADTTHRAAFARNTYGFDGTGIKIGVLSDGVRALAMAQASGDVGPVTVLPGQSGTSPGQCSPTGTCDEGTAMLELIHDIAPGAQLFFATAFGTPANFANNIRGLRQAGCDIIIDDVFYFVESPFQDGQAANVVSPNNQGVITQAVNDVTADGALYFSSAGNQGNENDSTSSVWEGDFVDGGATAAPLGAGRIHLFPADGATPAQTFNTNVGAGGPFTLNWADPMGASSNDYDLYILNAAGTAVAIASTNEQDGNDDPIELLNVNANVAGLRLVIVKEDGDPRYLRLTAGTARLTVNTPGQTFGHSCAAQAFGVAAVPASPTFPGPFTSANTVETFSSDGPRKLFFQPDGTPYTPGNFLASGGTNRQKPDIAAADGTSVTGAGGFPITFFGTSAAAPHAGAIAALLKSANPALTPAQVRTALQTTAIDIETPGVDRDAGHGIVMADSSLASLGLIAAAANVSTGTVTADAVGGNNNGFIEPGERGTLAVQLLNTGNTAATAVTATLSTTTPNVFITPPATRSYPDIAATNGTSSSATPFEFVLREGATYGVTINFTLTVTYNGGATRTFPMFIPTGRLSNVSTTLDTTAPPTPPEATAAATGTQTGRANFTFPINNCGSAKANPGTTSTLARRYDSYTFTNTSASTICVSVLLTHSANALLHAVAYVPAFVPATPTLNYAGDSGGSPTNGAGTAQLFSFNVAAGATFTVVVSESNQNGGLNVPYNLRVTGLPAEAVPANAAPAITAPSPQTTAEDAPLVFSTGSSNAISVSDPDAGSNPLQVTLQSTNGTMTLSGTAGLAFTTGDGTADAMMVFTGSAADINAALNGMTFSPAPNYNGPASVQITVDDQGFTGTGGAQTDTETVNIDVTPAPDISVSDVTAAEGNSGTTQFTFNVTLDSAAGPGGVTFDIATADGTASSATDYAAKSLTGQNIPEGSSGPYQFTVDVNGDTGQEPNETFFVNVTNVTGAGVLDGMGQGTILNDDGAPATGQIVISEFRLRGPAPSASPAPGNEQGQLDEFIELYNNTDSEIVVADVAPVAVSTAGWAIVSSDDPTTPKYVIPAGTTIPARSHFLVTNALGYSLTASAAADNVAGPAAASYNADIPDGAGLALYRTGTVATATPADRLDAVGFTVTGLTFVEGLGLAPVGGITTPAEHSFFRRLSSGRPQDTDDNAADFQFVSTNGGEYNGAQSSLGAPGPQNSASPTQRNDKIKASLIDPMVSFGAAPNTVRKMCADPGVEECDGSRSQNGTFSIRRRWTNNTGAVVNVLRFRLVNLTTGPTPPAGTADLRGLSSSLVTGIAVTGGGTVDVEGTTLETPPAQALGGGFNSTLAAGTITAATPLAPGASVNLQFLLGVQQAGAYSFFVNVEAVTGAAPVMAVESKGGAAQPKAGKATNKR